MPRLRPLTPGSISAKLLLLIAYDLGGLHNALCKTDKKIFVRVFDRVQREAVLGIHRNHKAWKILQQRRLIEVEPRGQRIIVLLTEEGARQAFRLKVLDAKKLPKNIYCMVIFDIPEASSRVRQELRRFLTSASFIQLQKSVWISEYDAGGELTDLFSITKTSGWIRVFTSKEYRLQIHL